MITKPVLTAMAIVLMAFSPAIASDYDNGYDEGRRHGEMLNRPSQAQERRDQQRLDWQKEDRSNQKKEKEEAETRAQDARREAAYAESRKARIAKSKRRAKAEGRKPYNSWQLNH